jgi:hypothetical protein
LERSPSSEQSAGDVDKILSEASSNQTIESVIENRGTAIMDATCCPPDIAYPRDLTLLSDAREKAEELIDFLYDPGQARGGQIAYLSQRGAKGVSSYGSKEKKE